MRLLLDTHAFLWFLADDHRLSRKATRCVTDARNERLLSIASVWEIAIKVGVGKLELDVPLAELIDKGACDNGIALLPIQREHVITVAGLPHHHRDPFDRLLVAQAMCEGLAVVGSDESFDDYKVRRIW